MLLTGRTEAEIMRLILLMLEALKNTMEEWEKALNLREVGVTASKLRLPFLSFTVEAD